MFKLIKNYFNREITNVVKKGIKLSIFGELKKLPKEVKIILKKSLLLTKNNKKIVVNLAINYGSKYEIVEAIKKIKKKKLITEKDIAKNLYSKNIPDPEILIRTGGHNRLSNFLLWQLAYSELYFLKKLWPDFQAKDLKKIVLNYKKIKRNFGTI